MYSPLKNIYKDDNDGGGVRQKMTFDDQNTHKIDEIISEQPLIRGGLTDEL